MTVSIPQAGGVPGISGPPDWLSAPPAGSFFLDDVRWRGATTRTFGSGASQGAVFRATQATVAAQKFIYLSFRASFVQEISDNNDFVYLGLQKHSTATAMVVRMQVHGPTFTPAGQPSANPPANIQSIQISTLAGGVWTIQPMTPTWINTNARYWLQNAGDIPSDPNNRWALQVRIPANTVGGITDNSGPNLGTDFDMWYLIQGSAAGSPVILADYRTSGTTTALDLLIGSYPLPAAWDEFLLTAGPASFGGVTIEGNGFNDVVVQNSLGTGTTIQNGAVNTFIARPRNYRPAGSDIPAGDINATFRIANWGSQAGNPENVDFATGVWDYVPGNNAVTPVISSAIVPTLPAGNNPPNTSPIALAATMNLAAGKSRHQCILVTLSGTNLTFLSDSVFKNMSYDHASLFEREAEINIVGLTPFSPQPRDVYLAIEKVNMARNTPDLNEGEFLGASIGRLMKQGGPIAGKLRRAQSILSDVGHNIPTNNDPADQRLDTFVNVLTSVGLTEGEFDQLFPTFRVHVYHDTGEKVTGTDGQERPVLRAQSSFGHYVYHEGGLTGWQTSIEGAQRIADNLYLIPVPNNGSAKIKTKIQAVENESERIPEDPIKPPDRPSKDGCRGMIMKLLGKK